MSPDELRPWVGRSRAVEDLATPFPVRALSATLDEADPDPQNGDVLPPLWHWLYFLEAAPLSKVGPDGHAERGDFPEPVAGVRAHLAVGAEHLVAPRGGRIDER